MYVRLNYGVRQGDVVDMRHDVAIALVESGRADKAEFDPETGSFKVPEAVAAESEAVNSDARKKKGRHGEDRK